MSNKALFDELVVQCSTELFRARGVELCVSAGQNIDATIEYAGVIGFSANEMRGVVGIGMNPAALYRLATADDASPANAEDWLGETVNQLVGRLKNKLCGYGIAISLALPTVLRGVRLEFLSTGPTPLWTYAFDSEAGSVYVWLDVRLEPGLVLEPTNNPEMRGTPEGEVVLF